MFKNSCRKLLGEDFAKGMSTKVKELLKTKYKMNSWQIHAYGDISEFLLTSTRVPVIESPTKILVKVEAASVNPIDLLMSAGYGRTLFKIPRKCKDELPLTLGRDFCGTVLQKGHSVKDDIKIGDSVYGFIPVSEQGTFAEIITADENYLTHKPPNLNNAESASLVYATMTAWSALFITGGLAVKDTKKAKVLVLGASGGVGTVAVQLLKSQGSEVIATCSTDAVPLVRSLGADKVFDYREKGYLDRLASEGSYQIILDCAKFGYKNIPKSVDFGTYITLNSPLLINTDKYGLAGGFITSAKDLIYSNLQHPGRFVKWGFFTPSSDGFRFIDSLIKEDKIRPVIHKEFAFEQLPEALQEVKKGSLRGKVVINV